MKIVFDFIGRRKIWYLFSLAIIIPGIISLMLQGLNLGIDFTGGNLMEIQFKQPAQVEQVRSAFAEYVKTGFTVQETGENTFQVQTDSLTEEENGAIRSALTTQLGANEVLRNEHVGPVVGRELSLNAFYALLVASVCMVVYITFRFEFSFAVAAILALLHDVLILVGIVSIFQMEVDASFVAVVLTIIGYSINDTIIIFDRIRENMRLVKKIDNLATLVNDSLLQTLARSINTVVTVVIMLLALLFLGGVTTRVFSLQLLVGILAGCYSSICVASPLWIDYQLRAKSKTGKMVKAKA